LSGFESDVAEVAVAVFVNTEPFGAPAGIFITKVKVAVVFAAKVAIVHVMVPPDPAEGVVQIGPGSWLSDTKVIPIGTSSVSDTLTAASGPRFVTFTVNGTLLPGVATAGPVLVTLRSALALPGVTNNK
jgi:hypothetical protein